MQYKTGITDSKKSDKLFTDQLLCHLIVHLTEKDGDLYFTIEPSGTEEFAKFSTQKETPMLSISTPAKARLQAISAGAPEGRLLRLHKEGAELKLAWDRQRPDDHPVAFENETVLIYDSKVEEFLDGRKIELQESDAGTTLAIV
jgi:Fe-S cluster assembly iron-binding protein IscA